MDEVYSTDGENIHGINPEITLQFGDFGSSILESAEDADDSSDAVSDLLSGGHESVHGNYSGIPGVENEQQLFTLEEVLKIVKYSNRVLQKREVIPQVVIKQEAVMEPKYQVPIVALKTIKQEPTYLSPRLQITTAAGGPNRQVQKKDYCNVTADHAKALREIRFTVNASGKGNYEKLESLYSILENIGILTIVKEQRGVPVITESNPLGFSDPYVIYRPQPSMSDMGRNIFEDIKGPYSPGTCTSVIAIRADDIVCYQNDLGCVKVVITLVFDEQLKLYVLPLLRENKIVPAFHSLVNKVRGRRQEDIDTARDNLAQFRSFDMCVDIHIGMTTLVKLFSAINFTTGIPMTESEMMRKFSQCVFQDERLVMHNTLLDSMARGHTYQESVDNIYRVMDLLPVDKQRLKPNPSINAINTGKQGGGAVKLYCFPFQLGDCSSKDCKFLHEKNVEAAERAKNFKVRKDKGGKSDGARSAGAKSEDAQSSKKKFNVNLSAEDRKFFGRPRGKPTAGNPEGWSEKQRHSINAVMASDQSRIRGSTAGPPVTDMTVYDPSTENLYDQFVNSYHQQSAFQSSPGSRVPSASAPPQFSHYINSFRVIPTSEIDNDGPKSKGA
jgi:hypothetical protein